MTDNLSTYERSKLMSRIHSKDTAPELLVRKHLHAAGYRYRLHQENLPGHPDLVFPGRKKIIFIHGCFWHGHENCSRSHIPKSNTAYWKKKIQSNYARDQKNIEKLHAMGWSTLVVWECQIKNTEEIVSKIRNFLETEAQAN